MAASKKSIWNLQNLATFTAVFISVCALVVSVMQTRIMKQQQEASVWPFVRWSIARGWSNDTTGIFKIIVSNSGVGPAIIEKVVVRYNYKEYKADEIQLAINTMMKDCFNGSLSSSNMEAVEQLVLSAGQSLRYIEIVDPKEACQLAKSFDSEERKIQDFDIIITYRDVYHNRWTINGMSKI